MSSPSETEIWIQSSLARLEAYEEIRQQCQDLVDSAGESLDAPLLHSMMDDLESKIGKLYRQLEAVADARAASDAPDPVATAGSGSFAEAAGGAVPQPRDDAATYGSGSFAAAAATSATPAESAVPVAQGLRDSGRIAMATVPEFGSLHSKHEATQATPDDEVGDDDSTTLFRVSGDTASASLSGSTTLVSAKELKPSPLLRGYDDATSEPEGEGDSEDSATQRAVEEALRPSRSSTVFHYPPPQPSPVVLDSEEEKEAPAETSAGDSQAEPDPATKDQEEDDWARLVKAANFPDVSAAAAGSAAANAAQAAAAPTPAPAPAPVQSPPTNPLNSSPSYPFASSGSHPFTTSSISIQSASTSGAAASTSGPAASGSGQPFAFSSLDHSKTDDYHYASLGYDDEDMRLARGGSRWGWVAALLLITGVGGYYAYDQYYIPKKQAEAAAAKAAATPAQAQPVRVIKAAAVPPDTQGPKAAESSVEQSAGTTFEKRKRGGRRSHSSPSPRPRPKQNIKVDKGADDPLDGVVAP